MLFDSFVFLMYIFWSILMVKCRWINLKLFTFNIEPKSHKSIKSKCSNPCVHIDQLQFSYSFIIKLFFLFLHFQNSQCIHSHFYFKLRKKKFSTTRVSRPKSIIYFLSFTCACYFNFNVYSLKKKAPEESNVT